MDGLRREAWRIGLEDRLPARPTAEALADLLGLTPEEVLARRPVPPRTTSPARARVGIVLFALLAGMGVGASSRWRPPETGVRQATAQPTQPARPPILVAVEYADAQGHESHAFPLEDPETIVRDLVRYRSRPGEIRVRWYGMTETVRGNSGTFDGDVARVVQRIRETTR